MICIFAVFAETLQKDTNNVAYAFQLAGYTAAIIAFPMVNITEASQMPRPSGVSPVRAMDTGSIFTYVSYWDSVFFSYCGAGTSMTMASIPG